MNEDDDLKDGNFSLDKLVEFWDKPFIERRVCPIHNMIHNSDMECPWCVLDRIRNQPDEERQHNELGKEELEREEEREEEAELEINGDSGQVEHKREPEPEAEPIWTEVRGGASFYFICPACGCFIPGTGPELMAADGVKRKPKEHHENYHRTIACDWYFGE